MAKPKSTTPKQEKEVTFDELTSDQQIALEAEAEVMGIASGRQLYANRKNAEKGGRPKGSVSESTRLKRIMHATLIRTVHKRFPELMKTKFELALGTEVYAVVLDEKTGKPKVDKETGKPIVELVKIAQPDPKSSEYLLDHVLGKSAIKIIEQEDDLDDSPLSPEDEKKINLAIGGIYDDEEYEEKRT